MAITFPEIPFIYMYVCMYASKWCSTGINLPCNLPGHCSDPLEEHDKELDRLAFSMAAWYSLNLSEKRRKETYEMTSNSLKLNSQCSNQARNSGYLLNEKLWHFPHFLWSLNCAIIVAWRHQWCHWCFSSPCSVGKGWFISKKMLLLFFFFFSFSCKTVPLLTNLTGRFFFF